jgi:hypothetical protein
MSAMRNARAANGTAAEADLECAQEYCNSVSGVAIVEVAGELRQLCRTCRKDLWRVSS